MTEFTKLKMAFTVALLAALFMLKPLFDQAAAAQFQYLNLNLSLRTLYYLFSGALGLSAYCFALELISGRSAPVAQRAGNTMYALAVLMPPAFLAIFVLSHVVRRLGTGMGATVLEIVLTVALGGGGFILLLYLRSAIGERDRSFTVSRMGDEETAQLAKANGLLEAGLYDLVVVQAFQTIETSVRRLLLAKGLYSRRDTIKDHVALARSHGLLGEEESQTIHDIRVLRNEVAHEGKRVNRDSAEKVLSSARWLITRFGMTLAKLEETTANGDEAATGT